MRAIILSADCGIRVDSFAKPVVRSLLPVRGVPIIEYIINKLKALDSVNSIDIVTNSRFYSDFKEWSAGYNCNIALSIIDNGSFNHKDSPGALADLNLALAKSGAKEDILVFCGSSLFSAGLGGFLQFARDRRSSISTGGRVYFFPKEKISRLKEEKDLLSISECLERIYGKDQICTYSFSGDWYEIGDVNSYQEAVFSF